MFECLVGYTPFYAEDPVTTCRKILRWRQCLEMPEETKAHLSPECIDFLSCLLAGPENRIGSARNGSDFENGFKQVVQHPWYRDFDWEGLRSRDGPLLPAGSREFPELLEYLKYVDLVFYSVNDRCHFSYYIWILLLFSEHVPNQIPDSKP
jgi:serine/threonine protein kinase